MSNLFKNGSVWLKADFHLHTIKDTMGIKYNNDNINNFFNDFINKLKDENKNIGVITNHNLFDLEEFKELKKKALKENIFLLSGIELSVTGGKNSIHTLIVFNYDEWINNRQQRNDIQKFLTQTFGTKTITPEESTTENLIQTIERLNDFKHDYFIILAHVDRDNGFFKETDRGCRERDYYNNKLFKEKVLAFQKVEKKETIEEIKYFYNNRLPAFVDGSDPKSIDDIGKNGKPTYLKIGSFDFESLKFSLLNNSYRISREIPEIHNTYITRIKFINGVLNDKEINFNSGMNNFIGIRGGGKSSVIESLRYILNKHIYKVENYKTTLIEHTLKSGGKVELELITKQNKKYKIEKILGEKTKIYTESGDFLDDISVEKLLSTENIIYFGQKDLSSTEENFNETLFYKLIGDKINSVRDKIEETKKNIKQIIFDLDKNKDITQKKQEYLEEIKIIEHRLEDYKKYKIDKKLEKQIHFQKDISKLNEYTELVRVMIEDINDIVEDYISDYIFRESYVSVENDNIFEKCNIEIRKIHEKLMTLKNIIDSFAENKEAINDLSIALNKKYESLIEEFAEVKRKINIENVGADDFLNYTRNLELAKLKVIEVEKSIEKRKNLKKEFNKLLNELQSLWHEEFNLIKNEAERINNQKLLVTIEPLFKDNKDDFINFIKEKTKGCNIRSIDKLAEKYNDNITIYFDLEKDAGDIFNIFSNQTTFNNFTQCFYDSLYEFLTYRPKDKIIIKYDNKPLKNHSVGQKASAILLFILTQQKNDIVIIDQPEDDIDNQTIYDEVIKKILELKGETQFIFATHNPNIPVLGDCEQIISCDYENDVINIKTGSIDNKEIQSEIIKIMEGGRDTFNKRKEIYNLWNH